MTMRTRAWLAAGSGGDAGLMLAYLGSDTPSGVLRPYGQAVSRSTYQSLFNNIGTTFGSGDGSTTFNVPDMRGRTPIGLDNLGGTSADRITDASADALAGNLGEEEHTLIDPDEIPQHRHTLHDHDQNNMAVGFNRDGRPDQPAGDTSNTGSDNPHNNMQPYMALPWIILHQGITVPVGAVMYTIRTTLPSGWLWLRGHTLSKSGAGGDFEGEIYRNLFNKAKACSPNTGSEDFDSGDLVTLPDARGRMLIGLDNLGGAGANRVTASEADTNGGTSGAEEHTLSDDEGARHRHSNTHEHDANDLDAGSVRSVYSGVFNTGTQGSDNPHANMQPYVTVHGMVKR